jgi:NAD(P)-dependent dehydrogenase (short-subunit alcohol dehydrogenase family)
MLEQSRLITLDELAQPSDIADIIVFLASDRASFITGEVVHADGGLCAGTRAQVADFGARSLHQAMRAMPLRRMWTYLAVKKM